MAYWSNVSGSLGAKYKDFQKPGPKTSLAAESNDKIIVTI